MYNYRIGFRIVEEGAMKQGVAVFEETSQRDSIATALILVWIFGPNFDGKWSRKKMKKRLREELKKKFEQLAQKALTAPGYDK